MTRHPVHWSALRPMAQSPLHYRYNLDHPITATPAMRFGSLVHAFVLNVAPRSFVVYEGTRRGNAWKEFKAEHDELEIVTSDEWARASECADAVKVDTVAGPLLKTGLREHKLTWEVAGRACAGTPDINGDVLTDLKVTPMTNPARFPWHAKKMLWHAQLAWYANGVGREFDRVSIIAVEPKPPFAVVVYDLTDDVLEQGARVWRGLFERLLVHEASDSWPGYVQCPVPLEFMDDELALTIDGEEVTI